MPTPESATRRSRPDVTCAACHIITCKQTELNVSYRIMYVLGPDGDDYIWVKREEIGACNVLNDRFPEEVELVHLGHDHDLDNHEIRYLLHLLVDVMHQERLDEVYYRAEQANDMAKDGII